MSESEPSQAEVKEDDFQPEAIEQPEQSFMEEPELQSVEEATALLRSCWKFAAVIQFSRMFAVPLKLKVFAADLLESALITPDNHRVFLSELLFKLLRADALQPYSEKDSEAFPSLLYRKVSAKWPEHFESHPLVGTTFYDITPTKRADVLFALCDWRAHDCPVVKDVIKRTVELADSSVDALRQEPVGEDSKGNLYYYFSFNNEDCRLYRQEPPQKKSAKRRRSGSDDAQWETVCTTIEEMAGFVDSLSASRSGKDKALHDLITADILPQLIESAAARRRAEEKQAAIEAMPKKRSSRLQELTSKKEEEDKRKAQQLAEKLHRQRENERITKEREREERLLARQREDERQVEIQRKLAGIHPEGPSREERLQRRLKSSQAGSSSDSDGIQIEQSPNSARSSARLHAQQQQHAHHQSSPPPPSHHHLHQEEEEQHGQPQHSHQYHHHQQQREQQQHQQPARQGHSRQQAQHAQHDQADSTDQAESGLLTRLRPRSTRRRTFQETFAWSPLDVPVPQRRRTDLDLRPRKNVAGLVAAAQGLSTGFGKNRRGKWVLNDQAEEGAGQETKGRSGGRPRSAKAASLSSAGPSSPAGSWDSAAGQQAKMRTQYGSTRQQYPLDSEPSTSYGQPQPQQQWMQSQRPGYAAQSAPYTSSWQQPQQQLQQQPQQRPQQQVSQQQQVAAQKAELESLVQQLTHQQRQHLAKMPHDKRMQFFTNLRNQMARAQQMQQQQMSQGGVWQQAPGLQQAGPGSVRQPGSNAQTTSQASHQQQQYQQQLQQLTVSRLSQQQMQQLQALPVEQRAMQFGSYMRETQLQLQQQHLHQQQQQFPSQAMAGYSSGMVPVAQGQQQQQQAGMSSQAHMAMPKQQAGSPHMRQMPMQQPGGYSSQAMYAQPGMMRQQPGGYPSMPQAYPSSASEQASRPMSPPGLPRGPSHPMAHAQRSQVKSPSGGYMGPQMIRPQMAGSQMPPSQMVGTQMTGNQMVGTQMATSLATSPKSLSALRTSSPGLASGGSSNGGHAAAAQPQLGPQPSNSGSSRPNSASSQEGSGSAGQGHGALVPQGARTASGAADPPQQAAALRYHPAQGAAAQMQQPGYGPSSYGMGWNGGMQPGMGPYANSSQPGVMQGGSMQGERPPQSGMSMQASQSYQNRLAVRPGLAPAHLQHQASGNPYQLPAPLKANANGAVPSAGLQVPVSSQLANSHSTDHGSGSGMSHPGQAFASSSGQTVNPYGSRNGMPAGLYGSQQQSQGNPYSAAGSIPGMGPSATGGAVQGGSAFTGASPGAGASAMPNGLPPVQSGAVARGGFQSCAPQVQGQQPAGRDEQPVASAPATQPGLPTLPASSDTAAVKAAPVMLGAAGAVAVAAQGTKQEAIGQTQASELSVKPPSVAAAGPLGLDTVSGAESNGNQHAELDFSVQGNDEGALDVLADAPQLIEPPIIAGQERFAQGLFAD